MKYVFFDIECADGGRATICSFGYVVTDAEFRIVEEEDIVINPEGRFYLTGRAGRPDVTLAYPEERFRKAPAFPHAYGRIKALLESEECCVVGHSVGDDVTYLNKACARYRLEPLRFSYFDTQRMCREVLGDSKLKSLKNALLSLGVEEEFQNHKSVEDARATMLLLQALLRKAEMPFAAYRDSTNRCTGATEGGRAAWDCPPSERELSKKVGTGGNRMHRGKRNHILFLRYLEHGEAIGEKNDRLLGKKVSVSMHYEREHFKEMLRLVGLIKAAGGEYVLKATQADIFATLDGKREDGAPLRCAREMYVREATGQGKEIAILPLEELLALLGTSREALAAAPAPNVEHLLAPEYGKPKA